MNPVVGKIPSRRLRSVRSADEPTIERRVKATLKELRDMKAALDEHSIVAITDAHGEAMTNALKHGRAGRIAIALTEKSGNVQLSVARSVSIESGQRNGVRITRTLQRTT